MEVGENVEDRLDSWSVHSLAIGRNCSTQPQQGQISLQAKRFLARIWPEKALNSPLWFRYVPLLSGNKEILPNLKTPLKDKFLWIGGLAVTGHNNENKVVCSCKVKQKWFLELWTEARERAKVREKDETSIIKTAGNGARNKESGQILFGTGKGSWSYNLSWYWHVPTYSQYLMSISLAIHKIPGDSFPSTKPSMRKLTSFSFCICQDTEKLPRTPCQGSRSQTALVRDN